MTALTAMTPRERWIALLHGRSVDRIPTDYWATPEFHQKLKALMDIEDNERLWDRLGIDRPLGVGPRCLWQHHPFDPEADPWGVRFQRVDHGTGSYREVASCPLAEARSVDEIHRFPLPTPDDYDYTPIRETLAHEDGTRPVMAGWFEPFLLYGRLRGLEQAFEDLLINPAIAEALLGRIFEFCHEWNRRILEAGAGRIDLFRMAEDLGSQHGPLMSVDAYRRFLRPNQARMADLARSHGAHVFYHTDGSARPFLPDLIDEVGIEILNPVQWRCPGMGIEGLVRDFGDRVVFHGAIDNQRTLAFGTPADVIREVRENARLFDGAGWICAPCHNIQPVSPAENAVAMYEAVWSRPGERAQKGAPG